jgi:hypothetical protein
VQSQNVASLDPLASPVDDPILLTSENAFVIGGAILYRTPVLDMRAFASLGMLIELTGGTFTATDLVTVRINYFSSATNALSERVYTDFYQITQTDLITSLPFRTSRPIYASHMELTVFDTFTSPRNVNMLLRLWGSKRLVPEIQYSGWPELVFSSNVAAGNTNTQLIPFFRGPAILTARISAGTGRVAVRGLSAGTSNIYDSLELTAADPRAFSKSVSMPTMQCHVLMQNLGGAAAFIRGCIAPIGAY